MIILNEVGPILAVIAACAVYFFRKDTRYVLATIILSILLYVFVIQVFIPDLSIEGVLQDPRVGIYLKNFNYFSKHPVFGIGIAGSVNITNAYQSAHNIFIEVACELGCLGLIPFTGMIILLFKKFIRNKEHPFSYIWLYSFIVVQFSGDIGLNTLFWFSSALFFGIEERNSLFLSILKNNL